MLYAALGIPLALLVLAELGKRFTVALKYLWAFVRRYYYTGYCKRLSRPFTKTHEDGAEHSEKRRDSKSESESNRGSTRLVYGYAVNEKFNLPIIVAVAILVIYILLGAFMYSLWEEWNYLEAFYFVFISISTIGFGDVIPAHPKFSFYPLYTFLLGFPWCPCALTLPSSFSQRQLTWPRRRWARQQSQSGRKWPRQKTKYIKLVMISNQI